LIGIAETEAALWKIYSQVAKPEKTIRMRGTRKDTKAVYNFHEGIVNAIRPTLNEGVKSLIITSPPRTSLGDDFLTHVRSHHVWLVQGPSKATFTNITGTAANMHDVTLLTRTPEFKRLVGETTTTETETLLELLEKRLNTDSILPLVLYSQQEAEDAILGTWVPGKPKPEILLLTDTYLSGSRQKNRLQRLMQVASNRNVKTRVVNHDSAAGKRLMQLGGVVCILKPDSPLG
jgi:stalled ribosome rescue protein Dom34